MRIGVYVGSFDPPHLGHKRVIEYVLDKNIVDKVLLLPTPNYWEKDNLTDISERVEMLKFYEANCVEVDSIHNNYPYTYQVLRSLKEDYSLDELYLIIGSDNLEKLHLWKNINEILENKIIVLKRGTLIKNKLIDDRNFIYLDDFQNVDVSSSDIRNGKRDNLDDKIKEYIKRRHLYEDI